jgi:hypothetical protein
MVKVTAYFRAMGSAKEGSRSKYHARSTEPSLEREASGKREGSEPFEC